MIRDRQTGDSLQYAFIEFADRKSCEEAYFKMDNVLIDDRRIHVDFSQSVAKMRWRGKGKGIQYLDDKYNEGEHENWGRVGARSKRMKQTGDETGDRRENDRRHRDEVPEHRKHDRRKESSKDDSEYPGNGGRYPEKEKFKDRKYSEGSRERHEPDAWRKKERRRRSRDRSRSESRDRSRDKNRGKKESHREHAHGKKRRERDSFSSDDGSPKRGGLEERHSNQKKKRNRDRSTERRSKSEKHKQKRR